MEVWTYCGVTVAACPATAAAAEDTTVYAEVEEAEDAEADAEDADNEDEANVDVFTADEAPCNELVVAEEFTAP